MEADNKIKQMEAEHKIKLLENENKLKIIEIKLENKEEAYELLRPKFYIKLYKKKKI